MREGKPLPKAMLTNPEFIGKFWGLVRKGPRPEDCWEWRGGYNNRGYPVVNFQVDPGKPARNFAPRRIAMSLTTLDFNTGMYLRPLCRNVRCVNPAHMREQDRAVLTAKGHGGSRGRVRTHCHRGHAMTPDNIRIRKIDGAEIKSCKACIKFIQDRWNREHPEYAQRKRNRNRSKKGAHVQSDS